MSNGLFEIIIIALIAAVLIWRLRSILGRHSEDDAPRHGPYTQQNSRTAAPGTNGNVIQMPSTSKPMPSRAEQEEPIDFARYVAPGSSAQQGLMDLHAADRSFHPASFIAGAKSAYEMIVTAFASGDRSTLKPLLSDTVYSQFEAAITDREQKNLTIDSEFIGVDKTEILDAGVTDRIAKVTIKFLSDLVTTTKNDEGRVVEGDPTKIKRVTDIWTFARDVGSSDPNWKLVGTSAATS